MLKWNKYTLIRTRKLVSESDRQRLVEVFSNIFVLPFFFPTTRGGQNFLGSLCERASATSAAWIHRRAWGCVSKASCKYSPNPLCVITRIPSSFETPPRGLLAAYDGTNLEMPTKIVHNMYDDRITQLVHSLTITMPGLSLSGPWSRLGSKTPSMQNRKVISVAVSSIRTEKPAKVQREPMETIRES